MRRRPPLTVPRPEPVFPPRPMRLPRAVGECGVRRRPRSWRGWPRPLCRQPRIRQSRPYPTPKRRRFARAGPACGGRSERNEQGQRNGQGSLRAPSRARSAAQASRFAVLPAGSLARARRRRRVRGDHSGPMPDLPLGGQVEDHAPHPMRRLAEVALPGAPAPAPEGSTPAPRPQGVVRAPSSPPSRGRMLPSQPSERVRRMLRHPASHGRERRRRNSR